MFYCLFDLKKNYITLNAWHCITVRVCTCMLNEDNETRIDYYFRTL